MRKNRFPLLFSLSLLLCRRQFLILGSLLTFEQCWQANVVVVLVLACCYIAYLCTITNSSFKSVYTISVVYDYPNNCDSFIAVVVPATAEKNVHLVKWYCDYTHVWKVLVTTLVYSVLNGAVRPSWSWTAVPSGPFQKLPCAPRPKTVSPAVPGSPPRNEITVAPRPISKQSHPGAKLLMSSQLSSAPEGQEYS